MNKPTLYLMLGYPGAGKTTVSKIIHDLTAAVHLWADSERHKMFERVTHSHQENLALYGALNQQVDTLLGQGKSVIFDTNFNFYHDREHMREIAAKHGAEVKLIWVQAPKAIAEKRATELSDGGETRVWGNMSVDEFRRMADNLREPLENEPYIAIDGTKVTPAYIKERLGL